MEKIEFLADGIKIKPPSISDEIKVEFTTGIYSLESLKKAFLWQGIKGQAFKITVETEETQNAE